MSHHTLRRGLIAGAAGTAVLNAVTYADMALRGRPASDAPEATVDALADRLGRSIPGDRHQRANRRTALGALSGTATGLAVGVLASVARRAGYRPGRLLGTVGTAAAAMAASDVPLGLLGVSDPRGWSATDWVADAVPHLAFAVTADAVIRRDARPEVSDLRRPATGSLVWRSAALGAAAGARRLARRHGRVVRHQPGREPRRAGRRRGRARRGQGAGDAEPAQRAGSARAAGLGCRRGGRAGPPRGGAPRRPGRRGSRRRRRGRRGGAAWRAFADRRVPDWQAALVEDAVALLLAALAALPTRRATATR
ncbi:hypothetical protein GCM10025868_04450 [Angustibacter aerolatus]|uniref:DUF4126 domain-containing protein n=1 Tax=Angustibacter aerolatus TaxID=1162965 RepID=A0ABQ6JEE2_9ACTN|nr:hypothetical protein GCM10025868_04450 [Angustibacter aerolatus]